VSRLAAFRRSVADAEAALELYLPLFEAYWAGQVRRMSRAAVTNLYAFQPLGLAAAGEPPFSMPDPDEVLHLPTERVIIAASVAKHWDAIMAILVEIGAESGISFSVRNRLVREVLTDRGQHITGIVETVRAEVMTQLQDAYDHGESLRKASRRVATAMGGASKRRATVIARTEMTGAVNGASVRLAQVMSGTSLNSDGSVRQDTLGHDPVNLAKRWYATPDRRTRPTHASANGQVVPIKDPFQVGGASLMYPGDPSGPGKEVIMCRCAVAYEELPVTTTPGGKLSGVSAPTFAPKLSDAENVALTDYSRASSNVNAALRGAGGKMPTDARFVEKYADQTRLMDAAFDRTATPADMTVYRGADSQHFQNLEADDVFVDYGYASTTKDRETASDFGVGGDRSIFEIRLPAGSRAIDINSTVARASRPHEQEVLLPRGSQFRVISRREEHGKYGTTTYFEVEVLA
jgi:hypothetical protein